MLFQCAGTETGSADKLPCVQTEETGVYSNDFRKRGKRKYENNATELRRNDGCGVATWKEAQGFSYTGTLWDIFPISVSRLNNFSLTSVCVCVCVYTCVPRLSQIKVFFKQCLHHHPQSLWGFKHSASPRPVPKRPLSTKTLISSSIAMETCCLWSTEKRSIILLSLLKLGF